MAPYFSTALYSPHKLFIRSYSLTAFCFFFYFEIRCFQCMKQLTPVASLASVAVHSMFPFRAFLLNLNAHVFERVVITKVEQNFTSTEKSYRTYYCRWVTFQSVLPVQPLHWNHTSESPIITNISLSSTRNTAFPSQLHIDFPVLPTSDYFTYLVFTFIYVGGNSYIFCSFTKSRVHTQHISLRCSTILRQIQFDKYKRAYDC